ncbi:heterokaryon incompatibility protein-domain-containing protein [Rhypophila decipiens]|uniref:Heterokaryon incompatibility protein-domain-containing protein n=1 Tax=Rhypophila decipiens TaxID=261697 RepID=A0AAN6YHQ1_9PEZI|nr:heterokaryon incompatibility protein-domain-containing protein [Rhypophila decipiens]
MCDGLADALKAKGTSESLEEALKLAQAVVTGFTNHKGQNHPRTQQAVRDLDAIRRLCESAKRQGATPGVSVEHATHAPRPSESRYEYASLPKPSAYRVLQYEVKDSVIHCSLSTVDEASTDVYSALSYTWASARPGDGLTADLTCKIFCEGKELYITQNLFDALSTLRIQPNTFLWVDAICINQNDLEERSSQVAMMGSIYARARYTIVWLGKPDHCSEVVHGLLQKLAPTVDALVSDQGADGIPQDPVSSVFWTKTGRQPFTPSEQMALVRFFDRYWFERCWIVQEVVLAKGVFCVCGGVEFKWTSLCNFSLYLLRSGWLQRLSRVKATSAASTTLEAAPPVGHQPMRLTGLALQCAQGLPVSSEETLVPAFQLRPDEVKAVFYRVLQHIIQKSRTSNATDPHDKVFAPAALALQLFSRVVDPGFFTISYEETVQETYTRAARLMVQNTQSLSLLTKVEDRSFRHISGLPSWVPDFSVPFVQPLDLLSEISFDCSAGLQTPCNPKFHQQTLEVQGVQVDTVGKTGPSRKESTIEACPSSWLDFFLHLDSQYVTGESSLEAFARTLIADQRDDSMTGDELVEAFYRYLLQLCAQSRELEQRIAAALSESSGNELTWPVLEALEATAEKGRGIPTLEEVLQYRFDVSASKTKEAELLVYNSKRSFEDAHYRVLLGRRLFRSEKGYIGLCPHSAREGDTVWIMPGCVVPIVLRQISGSAQGNVFELIGHCYVHGIMYGELFSAERTKNLAGESGVKDDLQVQSVFIE